MRHVCAFLFLAASANVFAAGPDPGKPYIKSISYSGTGCPQGTVGTSISNDRLTFTLIYDSFVASSGPAIPATEAARNCTLSVVVQLVPGWQTWMQTGSRRGYVQLPADVTATASGNYSMPAASSSTDSKGQSGVDQTTTNRFAGPVAKDYLGADGFPITAHAPNSCNQTREATLTVSLDVALSGNASAQAQITMDSFDGKLITQPGDKSSKVCQ